MNKNLLSYEVDGPDMEVHKGCAQSLPDRLIRLPEVMARVGLRRTAIYQRMREGRFPRSRSLGPRCTVWVEAEVEAWITSVVCERQKHIDDLRPDSEESGEF